MTQTVTDPVTGLRKSYTDDGAAVVSDAANATGIQRSRFLDVAHATLPTIDGAGGGAIKFTPPGVKSIKISSVFVSAGTVPVAANTNYTVRYALDAGATGATDAQRNAAAALLLPTTFPSGDPVADYGQVDSFNLEITGIGDYNDVGNADNRLVQLSMKPIYIPFYTPITRFDMAHNIGAGVVLIFGFSATEAV